ncbi:IQ calmodulin-binding motif containing protein, putative [Leishmania lindenbergi]|uniref:IQ calmodulin-binding motif containing protein n=1 Tax=Leishmania lindenbergi TaxID=651832 RepID=A0AAW3A9K7_9TRYP
MFTETQPKEVVLQGARKASPTFAKDAGIVRAAATMVHKVGVSEPMKAQRGSSATCGGGALPPIHTKTASTSETAVVPRPRKQQPLSDFQELQQRLVAEGQAFPVMLPAVGDLPGQRPSAALGIASTLRSGDEVPSSSFSPAPRRPPSTSRPAERHRRMHASLPRQARQPSTSPNGLRATSTRASGVGWMEGRRHSGQASRRTGLKSLKQQVEGDEAAADQLMQAGNTGGALMLLSHTLKSVLDYRVSLNRGSSRINVVGSTVSARAAPAAPPPGEPEAAWAAKTAQRLAEVYTVIANNAGVRCSTAAEPIQIQEAYFQAAMRYVVRRSTEDLFSEWTAGSAAAKSKGQSPHPPQPQSHRRLPARSAAPPSAREPPSCFSSTCPGKSKDGDQQQNQQPAVVRRLLRCAVRTNAAVCLGDSATLGGQARIIYELLKALAESDGVWSMTVLYNLAVAFLRVGGYDDAAEAIARFMELSWHYLEWAQHMQETDDDGGVTSVTAAVHTQAALQLICGHHFIAAMAAWCEPHGLTELYHCELASACAERYLDHADKAQRECQHRLAAAQARAAAAGASAPEESTRTATDGPPTLLLLPYMTQDLVFSCPSSTAVAAMGGVASTTVTVHLLVEALAASSSLSASLPAEVRAYVREVQKGDALRYWARAALRAGASPPFLSAAVAASTATPVPPALVVLLSHREEGEDVWTRESWMTSQVRKVAADDASSSLRRLLSAATTTGVSRASVIALTSQRFGAVLGMQPDASASLIAPAAPTPHYELGASSGAPSPRKSSKPAPLFVTTLPSSAYDRYRKLRDGVVTQLENAEQMVQQGAGVEDAVELLAVEGDAKVAARTESASSRSMAVSKSLPADAAAVHSRERHMTTLFVGASGTATSPAASLPREVRGGDITAACGFLGEEMPEYHDARSVPTTAALDLTLLGVPIRPSELLRQLDWETEARYSRLVADPLADLQRVASTCIQVWWRMQLARQVRRRRAADVETCLRRDAAAVRIQSGFRHWKECAPAKRELHRLRAYRERVRSTTILQAFVQQRASVEVWGRACLVWYKVLVKQREMEARRAAAAVTLQSWWRMHMARRQLCDSVTAVIRLQCWWRCALARRELRTRHVHHRLAQEQWRYERLPQIILVQRWWRACRSRWAVGDLLCQRQRSLEGYLRALESSYDAVMRTHLRSVENVEAAMRCVLAALAGARDRRQLGQLAMRARVRQRAVHSFVLQWRGREEMRQLRRDRAAALALQRRREEVAVATVTLQSWVRSWLPRRCAARERASRAFQHACALKIWDAFRHYRARQALVSGRTQCGMLGVVRRLAETRNDAATRIQSMWRMHCTQREFFDLLKFMLRDRHEYATAVQRCWRGHYARAVLAPRRAVRVREYEARLQDRTVLQCAAVRVQSFYRMYRTRIQLLRLGVLLPPTFMHRITAARCIQTSWRTYTAYRHVLYLCLQRSYAFKLVQSQEALHTYATLIQAAARSYLVRRGRLPRPEPAPNVLVSVTTSTKLPIPRPPSLPRARVAPESGSTPLHSVTSGGHGVETSPTSLALMKAPATVLQTIAMPLVSSCCTTAAVHSSPPDFGDRPSAPSLVTVVSPTLFQTTRAAKSCSNSASLSCLSSTPDKPLYLLQSDSTDGAWSARSARHPASSSGERAAIDSQQVVASSHDTARLSAPTKDSVAETTAYSADPESDVQAMMELPVAQCSIACSSSLCHHTPQEVEAAVRIQASWRGYRVRCTIEFYYEEYYEEVDEEGEEVMEEKSQYTNTLSLSESRERWDMVHHL